MNLSNNSGIDSNDLAKRGESLIRKSKNRYLTTVKIAFRAKSRISQILTRKSNPPISENNLIKCVYFIVNT